MNPVVLSYKSYGEARKRAHKLIYDVRNHLKIYKLYKFNVKLIGSQKRRCVIQDSNGKYDLDYQILLTKNSKAYKDDKFSNPTQIKRDFLAAFNSAAKPGEKFEDSTTAITLINKDDKPYSMDFVIIRLFPDNNEITD